MAYEITPRVAMNLASHEANVREAYLDSEKVWTWGVGITNSSGHNVDRYKDNPQTLERCMEVYVWALKRYAEDVFWAFEGKPLNEAQFAAALSFHYNTGGAKRAASSGGYARATWINKHLNGDRDGAYAAIMNWRTPASIIGRRTKERDLFFKGDWGKETGLITEYPVTASYRPNWRRARKVDVRRILDRLLADQPAAPDPKPEPDPVQPDVVVVTDGMRKALLDTVEAVTKLAKHMEAKQ